MWPNLTKRVSQKWHVLGLRLSLKRSCVFLLTLFYFCHCHEKSVSRFVSYLHKEVKNLLSAYHLLIHKHVNKPNWDQRASKPTVRLIFNSEIKKCTSFLAESFGCFYYILIVNQGKKVRGSVSSALKSLGCVRRHILLSRKLCIRRIVGQNSDPKVLEGSVNALFPIQ